MNDPLAPQMLSTFAHDDLDEASSLCLNSLGTKIYCISRTKHKFIQINLENTMMPAVEGVYTSDEHVKEPQYVLYDDVKELVFVSCYLSQAVLVFNGAPYLTEPTLLRVIGTAGKPHGMCFLPSSSELYIACKNNYGIHKIDIYNEEDTFQQYNIPSVYDVGAHASVVYCDGVGDGIGNVYAFSFLDGTITSHDESAFNMANMGNSHSIGNVVTSLEHVVKSINRDVTGFHVLELETSFPSLQNIVLRPSTGTESFYSINKDLQCCYLIQFVRTLPQE
jgi:hypothetical protein